MAAIGRYHLCRNLTLILIIGSGVLNIAKDGSWPRIIGRSSIRDGMDLWIRLARPYTIPNPHPYLLSPS